ncbi:MAG TPA: hypothetical protein VFS29_06890 [Motilibacteraceae bacterium]|nr:hypothetical protein [Motilibacteraceae bacterium]
MSAGERWRELREELAREERRVVDRLRGLSLDRLGRAPADGPTPADAARVCAQALADLAADLEAGPRRTVPVLAAHAAADQVAVIAHDVALAAAAHAADDVVGERSALDALAAAVDALAALRRALP